MVKQSEQVQKFYDARFGELNIALNGEGEKMYCLTDICQILELLKREGDRIVKQSKCYTQEFFVKRIKQIVSREFVDESGLISLVTESRKNKADKFRMWAIGLGVKVSKSAIARKRVSDLPRGENGKWMKKEEQKVGCDEEGYPYPTLEEYFKDFVPLDYLIPMISETMKDYLKLVQKEPESHKREVEHRCSVLNTLNLTLIANKNRFPGRSYAKK